MANTRVWLYCRVSEQKGAARFMKRQEARLRQALDPERYAVAGVTHEYGSGLSGCAGWQRLLEEARNGRMDEVWALQIHIFGRDWLQILERFRELVNYGIAVRMQGGNGEMTRLSEVLSAFLLWDLQSRITEDGKTQEEIDREADGFHI